MIIEKHLDALMNIDLFKEGKVSNNFIGRPFYIDYNKVHLLVSDAWKYRVKGIPQGTFLLAFYIGEDNISEALLLRAIGPTKLPTDNDVVSSMIEYYKDDMDIAGRAGSDSKKSKLDEFTRYEFSFSGLECRILGAFYKIALKSQDEQGKLIEKVIVEFGADVENFYSANNYNVYKATGKVLKHIVNQRDGNSQAGSSSEFQIGKVRYSSSRRFQISEDENVDVYISPKDFLGKRTALFGMTRTGKSNTIKKIIEATVEISKKAQYKFLSNEASTDNGLFGIENNLDPFSNEGSPKFPVGQIIFDINGEYANANMQDEGTAIFELYPKSEVIRYSVLDKSSQGFKVLKINFYNEIASGFDLIKSSFSDETSDYIKSFIAVDLYTPENYRLDKGEKSSDDHRAANIYDRKKALYQCCLFSAGFQVPKNLNKLKFYGDKETINKISSHLKPHEGLTFLEAVEWFTSLYEASGSKAPEMIKIFEDYRKDKGYDFIDEDMKALLVFLTRKTKPTSETAILSGFRKLNKIKHLHTSIADKSFEIEIMECLRQGKIVIIDLSQGDPKTQQLYSERICRKIFEESMARFIDTKPNNFIQFYFEEAHNLFPKKDDKDLSQIYNRIAKEGAKLNLGMIYATQEVSSISANILKNTQNWFIAHLNNEDETKELKKYYDFADFTDSLIRFSASNDKGFVRMKTYTNPFVVPVQIDRFLADRK